MKKHIVKIMMLLAVPALAVVSCDSYDRTEVEDTITVDYNKVTLFEGETKQLKASPSTLNFAWSSSNENIIKVVASDKGECTIEAVAEGAANVVAQSGDMIFEVECIVQEKVPITGVKFRDDIRSILTPGNTRTLIISQIPSGGNDIPMTDFEWWVEDENIARVSQAGVVKALNYGETKVFYRRGPYEIEGVVRVPEGPYTVPLPVLTRLTNLNKNVKEWDKGGEGVGYHDTKAEGPTVESAGNIGYCATGEWLAYTIYVLDPGKYKLTMYGSSNASSGSYGGSYQWFLNEPNVAENALGGTFKQQSGGEWGKNWKPSQSVTVELKEEGLQRLIFYMHDGAHNFIHFNVEYVGALDE